MTFHLAFGQHKFKLFIQAIYRNAVGRCSLGQLMSRVLRFPATLAVPGIHLPTAIVFIPFVFTMSRVTCVLPYVCVCARHTSLQPAATNATHELPS